MQSESDSEKQIEQLLEEARSAVKNAHYWSFCGAHEQARTAMLTALGALVTIKEKRDLVAISRQLCG